MLPPCTQSKNFISIMSDLLTPHIRSKYSSVTDDAHLPLINTMSRSCFSTTSRLHLITLSCFQPSNAIALGRQSLSQVWTQQIPMSRRCRVDLLYVRGLLYTPIVSGIPFLPSLLSLSTDLCVLCSSYVAFGTFALVCSAMRALILGSALALLGAQAAVLPEKRGRIISAPDVSPPLTIQQGAF